MNASFHDLSLQEAANLLRQRVVSPVEITKALLERIEEYDSSIHAFITVTPEQALDEARRAEQEIMRGDYRGPLHGIAIAYKDNIETAGLLTSGHSQSLAHHVPTQDADVVMHLKRAGAISLGKLSLQELAYGSPGRHDPFAPARNPWNVECSPGGSSSGSGAAVAAGYVYAAVGTDTGGSIRHPAAVCGIVGMKPSYGLISSRGTIALSPTQDHVGPLTRHVADNALMLSAMGGGLQIPRQVHGLRVGVPFDLIAHVGLDETVRSAFERSLECLKSLGAAIVAIDTPRMHDFNAIGTRIIVAEAWKMHGEGLRLHPEWYGDAFRGRVAKGEWIDAAQYGSDCEAQAQIQQAYQKILTEDVDFIVSPGREEPAMSMASLIDSPFSVRGNLTRMYNLARVPALVMPMGFTSDGLPMGLQIAAASGCEGQIYHLAEAMDQLAQWTRIRPDLSKVFHRPPRSIS